jgi:hypothetical protein
MLSGLFILSVICELMTLLDFLQRESPQRMASICVGRVKHESFSRHVLRWYLHDHFVSRASNSSLTITCAILCYSYMTNEVEHLSLNNR